MIAAHSSATTHAPAHPERASARPERAPDGDVPASDSLWEHAKRSLRTTEGEVVASLLNPLIAWLLRLRKLAGAVADSEPDPDRGGTGARAARQSGRPNAPANPVKSRVIVGEEAYQEDEDEDEAVDAHATSRLFSFLVYLCVLLAGSIGGGALAFNLLERLLSSRNAENVRLETAVQNQVKASKSMQKQLVEAQAKLGEADKKLDAAGVAAMEKKLQDVLKKREELEKKLDSTLAESTKAAAEKQKRLDEAVKALGTIIAAERGGKSKPPGNRGGAESEDAGRVPVAEKAKTSTPINGNCTLSAGNVAANLKDCVAEFKR